MVNMENYNDIILKAKELSDLINNNEITVKYRESLEKMKDDSSAQKLLSELVMMGRDLNATLSAGTEQNKTGAAEMKLLREEFEKNENVKNHILAQKEYLNLIKLVQERIKNPLE